MNNNKVKISCKQGFTLIEVLVVVLIIAILAAVALPQYKVAVTKARVGAMLPLMASLSQAQETYYLAQGEYTGQAENLDVQIPSECSKIEENSDVRTLFSCGKYSLLGIYNVGTVNLHYCPEHNQDMDDCKDNRTIHITFRPKHWGQGTSQVSQSSKRYCLVYHDSKLAQAVCASLGLLTDLSQ